MKRYYHVGNVQWGYRLFVIQTIEGLRFGVVEAEKWRVIVEPKYKNITLMGNYAIGEEAENLDGNSDEFYILLETGETFCHSDYPRLLDRLVDGGDDDHDIKLDFIADFFYIPLDDPGLPISKSPDDWSTIDENSVRWLKTDE